jgi:hypothetical protein
MCAIETLFAHADAVAFDEPRRVGPAEGGCRAHAR